VHSPSNTPAYQRQNQRASIQQLARFFFRKKTKNNMKKNTDQSQGKNNKKKVEITAKKIFKNKIAHTRF
jgi:hypothetical protein